MQSDIGRYSELMNNIKAHIYLVRDEHPINLTSTYELLVFNSMHVSNDRGRYIHGNYKCRGRCSQRTSFIFSQDINNERDDRDDKIEYCYQQWTVLYVISSVTTATNVDTYLITVLNQIFGRQIQILQQVAMAKTKDLILWKLS